MNKEIILTIITGVCIFTLSQVVLYFFLKPRQEYIESAGLLSSELLQLTSKYTNFHLTDEEINRLKKANATYVSSVWKSDILFRKKRRKNGLEIARNVNTIIGLNQSQKQDGEALVGAMNAIEELDKNIIIRFDR